MKRKPIDLNMDLRTCDAETTRQGILEHCGRPATNLRWCPPEQDVLGEGGYWWPTCHYHTMRGANGETPATLTEIIKAAQHRERTQVLR